MVNKKIRKKNINLITLFWKVLNPRIFEVVTK